MTEAALLDDPTFRLLLDEFTRSGLRELHVRRGDIEIYLSSDAALALPGRAPAVPETAAPPPVLAAAIPTTPAKLPDDATIVRAPNLGTFYRAPRPGAEPYVAVGTRVARGDELCLIEVMKLFTAVRAEADGQVAAILCEDGAMVEAGAPLFALRVAA